MQRRVLVLWAAVLLAASAARASSSEACGYRADSAGRDGYFEQFEQRARRWIVVPCSQGTIYNKNVCDIIGTFLDRSLFTCVLKSSLSETKKDKYVEEFAKLKYEVAELRSHTGAKMRFLQKDNAALVTELRELRLRLNKQDVRAVCRQPTLGLGKAACAFTESGGPWTVIQRRTKGDVLFSRNWEQYRNGFGDTNGDYWIGLQAIYELYPQYRPCEVRFEFTFPGKPSHPTVQKQASGRYFAQYGKFSIEGPASNYKLAIGNYDRLSTATDMIAGIWNLNGRSFSTMDADHDIDKRNCARFYGGGGWWYGACGNGWLNGAWKPKRPYSGIYWNHVTGRAGATSSRISIRIAA